MLWQSSVAGSSLIVRALVLIVLARHLPAHDFGIVAAASVMATVAQTVTQIGLSKTLIQRLTLEERHIRTALGMSLAAGTISTALFALAAPILAAPFRMEGLEAVLELMAVLLLLNALTAVPLAMIHRARKFRNSSVIDLVSFAIGYGAVGLVLALHGFGYWSLAIAEVCQAALRMALYLAVARPGFAFWPDRQSFRELVQSGPAFSAGQIGNLVAREVDNVIVGRMLGAEALGLYSRAYQFLMLPAQMVGSAAQIVLFPSLAAIQDQPKRVARAFERALGIVAMPTIPASGVLMVLAPELVVVTLGPNWREMTVPFQILIATLLFRTSCKISDSVLLATGSMRQRAWRQWIYAGAVTIAAIVGARWGLEGVAAGVAASVILHFFLLLRLALQRTGVSAMRVLNLHMCHTLAGLPVIAGSAIAVTAARAALWHPALVLATGLAVAAMIFSIMWWRCRWAFGADGKWAHSLAASRVAPLVARYRGDRVAL